MLAVFIRRFTPDGQAVGEYLVEVKVTTSPTEWKTIAVAGGLKHERGKGWRELLRLVADEAVGLDGR